MGKKDDLLARAKELDIDVPANATIPTLERLVAEKEGGTPAGGSGDADNGSGGSSNTGGAASNDAGDSGAKDQEALGDAPSITVVGPGKGRRRIGRRFTPEPTSIPLSELEGGELEALRGDPLLIVSAT